VIFAHDCVKFVGLLLQSYFDRDPFGDCSVYEKSKVEEGIFPRKLTWEGCWASLNSSPDDLLNPFNLASLVKRLGGNAVTATSYERPIVYSLNSQCSGKRIERIFLSSSKKHLEMPVEFSMTHDSRGIAVEIFVRESLAAGSHHYRVEMYCNVRYSADNFAYNFNDIPYWEQYMKKAGYSIDPKVMLGADEHMGWLSFKWRDLPEEFTSGKASLALLVIVRWGGANELSREGIQAIAVCPLDITFA